LSSESRKALLVGDNPFHSISHLSQDRIKLRGEAVGHPERAASLILMSLDNGANGFMFSVDKTTLTILDVIREKGEIERLSLYAIVPYAYEYVRLATQVGGIPGLAKTFVKQLISSGNVKAMILGVNGVLRASPVSVLKTYLAYEISRIRSSVGKKANLQSVLLHEVVTDMALALDSEWFFRAYIDLSSEYGFTPGFNTCNFAHLVNKLNEWDIDLSRIVIAAPFNKVGFQMNPSRADCEKALESVHEPILIAISVLAAGYLKLTEAIEYIAAFPNIRGVAVGVSKERHAYETFRFLKEKLASEE